MSNQFYKDMTDEERFWCKVEKKSDDECWNWIGQKDEDEYGKIKIAGKVIRAHRYSYSLHHGTITKQFICHSCDNPSCVNPKHLWPGTPKENMIDKVKKNRQAKGKQQGELISKAQINMKKKNNKSGVVGVSFDNTNQKWVATFKNKRLGGYDNKEDAIKIRQQALKDYENGK